jgi:hypothetical protein
MRTLENEALAQCCNIITSRIKQLWKIHYAQTTEQIENYETVQIPVPKQTNKQVSKKNYVLFQCMQSDAQRRTH